MVKGSMQKEYSGECFVFAYTLIYLFLWSKCDRNARDAMHATSFTSNFDTRYRGYSLCDRIP